MKRKRALTPDEMPWMMSFHQAAALLGCTLGDIKALVLSGRLRCMNFGHDRTRILMTTSRVAVDDVKRLVIAQVVSALDCVISTADERAEQRRREEERQRQIAWKEEWRRRHTGEAYYDPDGQWYVYTLSTPADRIFYVGKGCGDRVDQHEKEARKGHRCHKCNTIRRVWREGKEIKKAIVFRTHIEQAAYDYESALIARIGLSNLTNISPGGGIAVSQGPKRDDCEVNLYEKRYYLKIRGVKPERIRELVRERMRDRIEHLEDRIYVLRRYGTLKEAREKKAQEYEAEVEALWIALGKVDQHSFLD